MRDFHTEIFFRIPSCLEQLLPSYRYFLVTILFLISYFLKLNTFSRQLMFRWRFFSRISNYSEQVLFQGVTYSEQILFLKRNLFRARYFLKKSLFLTVLRNQFHSGYTWKGFPLTSIHSFKYSMVRHDFEIPRSFIVENSNQLLISIVLQMCLFENLVLILVSSNNLRKIVRITCYSKDVAMRICWK